MGGTLFQPASEHVLEWVLLLSLAASGLCVLSLLVMMFVGRWQHAVRQRAKRRRRALLRNDIRDLEVMWLAKSQTAEAEKKQLPLSSAEELEPITPEQRAKEDG
jgi:hypothetical protein